MRAHIFTPRGILLKMHKDSIFKEMKKGAGIFTLKKMARNHWPRDCEGGL